MSFGKDELFTALNVPVITNELDTFKTKPALWPDNVVSSDFDGNKSINFYSAIPFDPTLPHKEYGYTINCRANSYLDSQNLAEIVVNEINRSHYTGYYIIVSVLATIQPENDLDNYNTPVEATIKQR